jgi:acetyl esterase/lipase/NAD-dependent SIR2 family protein deacetylase
MDEGRRARLRDPQAPRLLTDLLNGRPAQAVRTTDTVVPAPGRDIPVRVYRPSGREGEPLPLVVHFPGGGWMFARPRSSEHLCSHLAERLPAVVVSVGYRLSPEHPAPAALEDALAATAWAHANARVLGARDGHLAVMGDSSGGTLAAGVALADKEAVAPLVAAQALIYPLTDLTGSGASVDARPHEPFLSRDDLHAYLAAYLAGGADPRDPLLSPLWAPDLAGLSPALVLAADHDPLVDDARRYVDRLRAADVPVQHVEYADSPHGFLTFPARAPPRRLPWSAWSLAARGPASAHRRRPPGLGDQLLARSVVGGGRLAPAGERGGRRRSRIVAPGGVGRTSGRRWTVHLASAAMDVLNLAALTDLVRAGDVAVLSGAGLSTDSGIPDYRGPSGAARPSTPMTVQVFLGSAEARRRYWARSHLGWRVIARAQPNDGHRAVAALEAQGLLSGIITQNVDGLHTAGGRARWSSCTATSTASSACTAVTCPAARGSTTGCGRRTATGPPPRRRQPGRRRHAPDEVLESFRVVDCLLCGGVLKPDVVYFGETVPAERVQACFALVERSRALLVLGSSLTVMSGYRFVLRAAKLGIPVAIVNQGATRGDAKAALRLDAPLGVVLPHLAEHARAVRLGSAV